MTKKSCIYIPDKLFGDILKIMGGDRGVTKILWSLSQSKTAKEQFGINEKMSASEVIEKIGNKIDLKQMLTDRQFSNYIQAAEKLDEYSFESYGDLKNKQQDIRNKYGNVIPIAQNANGNYRIEVQPKDSASKKAFAKQRALENMNGRLIDYIERLGFAVREVEGLGMPGVFSPLDAETNA